MNRQRRCCEIGVLSQIDMVAPITSCPAFLAADKQRPRNRHHRSIRRESSFVWLVLVLFVIFADYDRFESGIKSFLQLSSKLADTRSGLNFCQKYLTKLWQSLILSAIFNY